MSLMTIFQDFYDFLQPPSSLPVQSPASSADGSGGTVGTALLTAVAAALTSKSGKKTDKNRGYLMVMCRVGRFLFKDGMLLSKISEDLNISQPNRPFLDSFRRLMRFFFQEKSTIASPFMLSTASLIPALAASPMLPKVAPVDAASSEARAPKQPIEQQKKQKKN